MNNSRILVIVEGNSAEFCLNKCLKTFTNLKYVHVSNASEKVILNTMQSMCGIQPFEPNAYMIPYSNILLCYDMDIIGRYNQAKWIINIAKFWPWMLSKKFVWVLRAPYCVVESLPTQFFSSLKHVEAYTANNQDDLTQRTFSVIPGLGGLTLTEMENFKQYFKWVKYNRRTSIVQHFTYKCTKNFLKFNFDFRHNFKEQWIPIDILKNDVKEWKMYTMNNDYKNFYDGLLFLERLFIYAHLKGEISEERKLHFVHGITEVTKMFPTEQTKGSDIFTIMSRFMSVYAGNGNIKYFKPIGVFGSRQCQGQDIAEERYLQYSVNPILKLIFPPFAQNCVQREKILNTFYRPLTLLPIIPPSVAYWCNPINVAKVILNLLTGSHCERLLVPYFDGFKGEAVLVVPQLQTYWIAPYVIRLDQFHYRILDYPILCTWKDYDLQLQQLIREEIIVSYSVLEDDAGFEVELPRRTIQRNLHKYLKLCKKTKMPITCINESWKYEKYNNIETYIQKWYTQTLQKYGDFYGGEAKEQWRNSLQLFINYCNENHLFQEFPKPKNAINFIL